MIPSVSAAWRLRLTGAVLAGDPETVWRLLVERDREVVRACAAELELALSGEDASECVLNAWELHEKWRDQ